jgi:hypothetical protein
MALHTVADDAARVHTRVGGQLGERAVVGVDAPPMDRCQLGNDPGNGVGFTAHYERVPVRDAELGGIG